MVSFPWLFVEASVATSVLAAIGRARQADFWTYDGCARRSPPRYDNNGFPDKTTIWQPLPEFSRVAVNPGARLPRDTFSDLVTVGVLCVMEISFWVRVRYIAIRFRHPSMIQHHALLILGRLSFIFGSVAIPSELLLTPAG
jgi:hypothetical protein